MRKLLIILVCSYAFKCAGQAQLILNNDVDVVMNNSVYLVVDNSNADAVSTTGTGGNIISEDEFNIVKWNIGTATGNYIIPFTSASGNKIPLQLNITTGGTGGGNIQFSTYNGPTWDNFNYKPTGVTNMTNMGFANNSSEVIDRFWIIDAQSYTTKPAGMIQFNYIDAEHTAVGNTINEADLKAERYEDISDSWEIYPVGGVINTTSNYVSGVPVNSMDFTRTWTLIDQTTHLLPLVLIAFEATCDLSNTEINWTTAQEMNTDYFILELSEDGIHYNYLTTIPATGNSTSQNNYSYVLETGSASYYRLILVNRDGSSDVLGIISSSCGMENNSWVNAFSSGIYEITIETNALNKGLYNLQLIDLSGKVFLTRDLQIDNLSNHFIINDHRLAAGIYIVRLTGNNLQTPFLFTRKVWLFN